jgi:hypothetical protein
MWKRVCYGNGVFVATSDNSAVKKRIMYGIVSNNSLNWTAANYPIENAWFGIFYGSGLFVTTAYSGTGNRVMTSPDGINWTSRYSSGDNLWYSVCYGNGKFVAVSATGGIANQVMVNDYNKYDNTIVANGSISVNGINPTSTLEIYSTDLDTLRIRNQSYNKFYKYLTIHN